MESDFTIRNELDAVQPSAEIPEPPYSPNPAGYFWKRFGDRVAADSTASIPQYEPSNHFSFLQKQQLHNYQITQQLISIIKWGVILGAIFAFSTIMLFEFKGKRESISIQ